MFSSKLILKTALPSCIGFCDKVRISRQTDKTLIKTLGYHNDSRRRW